jgi:FkbM family methyltransferase
MLFFASIFILVLLIGVFKLLSNKNKNHRVLQEQLSINARQTQLINMCQAQLSALKLVLSNDIQVSKEHSDLFAAIQCKHGIFKLNLSDVHVSRSLLFYGEWMEDEIELLSKVLREGDVVFDIGANIGTHTIAFAKLVGIQGKVIAFEPQPMVAQSLLENLALNNLKNVNVIQSVVCEPGRSNFKLDFEDKEKIAGNQAGVSFVNMEEAEGDIPSICLDQLLLLSPKLIKIDAEGMEVNVLNGATKIINSFRPVIYAENHERKFSSSLLRTLFNLNYDCYWHLVPAYNPDNYLKRSEDIWAGQGYNINMLCLPKEKNVPLKGLIRIESETEWIDDKILIDYSKNMSRYRVPIKSISGLDSL